MLFRDAKSATFPNHFELIIALNATVAISVGTITVLSLAIAWLFAI
jgi:hypothetical protein